MGKYPQNSGSNAETKTVKVIMTKCPQNSGNNDNNISQSLYQDLNPRPPHSTHFAK
jgi:hypothetical protein